MGEQRVGEHEVESVVWGVSFGLVVQCDGAGGVGVVEAAPFAYVSFEHAADFGCEFFVVGCGAGVGDGGVCVGDADGAHDVFSLLGLGVRRVVGLVGGRCPRPRGARLVGYFVVFGVG